MSGFVGLVGAKRIEYRGVLGYVRVWGVGRMGCVDEGSCGGEGRVLVDDSGVLVGVFVFVGRTGGVS